MTENVILVTESDEPTGEMEKMEAHRLGKLHRAFSVFVFNNKGQMLLQQRALEKYHSPGLWTNTCCSHPRPGEDTLDAAKRRLNEEMGLSTELIHKGTLLYRAEFDNGLTEHEFDHIYFGNTNLQPVINTEEVQDYKWMGVEELKQELKDNPEAFTYWFKLAMGKFF